VIIELTVNGERRSVQVDGWESLLWVLREHLGLPGSKPACEQGECGACSVILDGDLVCSCLVMIADAEAGTVVTVEGLGTAEELHPVQAAFHAHGAVQCGFCTPGLVVAAAHLLEHASNPSMEDIREALSGNICRCTGYGSVLRAVASVAADREETP
jgi:carbon-monoxide dehydrogenase small subunit